MESATLQLQIFVSMLVVLGTIFVALLCDYLKGSNEQLRERNLELQVRREERERQAALTSQPLAAPVEPAATPRQRPVRQPSRARRAPESPNPEPAAVLESASIHSYAEIHIEPAYAEIHIEPARKTGRSGPRGKILSMNRPAPERAVAPAEPSQVQEVRLPVGEVDKETFQKLVKQSDRFAGIVVAVSIINFEEIQRASGSPAADALIGALMGLLATEGNFACRTQGDEFAVVYPAETGPAAQRRIAQVSERLWDFQLRSLGSQSVQVSWAAADVEAAELSATLATAQERMYQTRRSRAGEKMVVNA